MVKKKKKGKIRQGGRIEKQKKMREIGKLGWEEGRGDKRGEIERVGWKRERDRK